MPRRPITENTLFYGDNLFILREHIPQRKADITQVSHGYSFTTPTFYTAGSFIRTLDKVREQWFPFLLEIPFLVGLCLRVIILADAVNDPTAKNSCCFLTETLAQL